MLVLAMGFQVPALLRPIVLRFRAMGRSFLQRLCPQLGILEEVLVSSELMVQLALSLASSELMVQLAVRCSSRRALTLVAVQMSSATR